MVEAVMLWNEPNNLSHWDFKIDPGVEVVRRDVHWRPRGRFVQSIRNLKIMLGGISPIDPHFIELLTAPRRD